jgi:uncharacterized membrane protein
MSKKNLLFIIISTFILNITSLGYYKIYSDGANNITIQSLDEQTIDKY